jgi:hypothetical protein
VPLVISQRMVSTLVNYVKLVNINQVLDPSRVTVVQMIADVHGTRVPLLSINVDVSIECWQYNFNERSWKCAFDNNKSLFVFPTSTKCEKYVLQFCRY